MIGLGSDKNNQTKVSFITVMPLDVRSPCSGSLRSEPKIFVAKWVWQDRGPILTASVGKDGFADLCIEMVIWQGIERGLFTNTICNLQALF